MRLLGSVGESINPEAWRWLREHVGGGTAAFIDTWWQSETGSTVCSPRPHDPAFAPEGTYPEGTPHCTPLPGCATRAVPGVSTRVVDEHGDPVEPGKQGFIVVDKITLDGSYRVAEPAAFPGFLLASLRRARLVPRWRRREGRRRG